MSKTILEEHCDVLKDRSCSSADVNPIGGISKTDLKRFIAYAEAAFDLPILGRWVLRGVSGRDLTDKLNQ